MKNLMCHLMTQGLKANVECECNEAVVMAAIMINVVQTHALKAGIKKFGARGEDAAFDEMNQLNLRECFYDKRTQDWLQWLNGSVSEQTVMMWALTDSENGANQCF